VLESGGRTRSWRAQLLLGGESVGLAYPRLAFASVSAFGGSSHHWGPYWHSRPLDAIDFEARDGIEDSGWPFGRDDLAPYYERAERYFGLAPFDYDAPASSSDLSSKLPVRQGRLVGGELQHGACDYGRELEHFAATDVRIVLGAHVSELLADEKTPDRIAGVRAFVAPGTSITVRAGVTVLAAGGIGNARLLLLGNERHAGGIGNGHDLVGRYFMEHLALRSGVLVPNDPQLLERQDLFSVSPEGTSVRTIALSENVLREGRLLNTYLIFDPRPRVFIAESLRWASTLARGVRSQPLGRRFPAMFARGLLGLPAVGRAVLAARRRGPEVFVVRVQAEQAPNPASRVTLAEARNRFGIRNARLDWRLLPIDLESIRRTQAILRDELQDAGLGRMSDLLGDERPPATMAGLYHHLGTTRMHEDPRHGVVDPFCRVHGIAGLYVIGGSVFPTSGAANPTLTIVALALRLADELKKLS
jgi:choline dehydrogenase-like flavoprotein